MKINYLSFTFWFNIYENHNSIINDLNDCFKDEYSEFKVNTLNNDNYLMPIISANNRELKTSMTFSKINFQYNINKVDKDSFKKFKDCVLKSFELLTNSGVEILHSALFLNGEYTCEKPLDKIAKNTINNKIYDDDLIDINLKIGRKYEDIFYKIITILNKKEMELPYNIDSQGRTIPLPLVTWGNAKIKSEAIDISYEINDKYSYDIIKNYHTSEFFLNKMLYILENNLEDDIKEILTEEL